MTELFHVSDGAAMTALDPRPSPAGTPRAGQELIWAVDREHLPHYLLPRDCPRVCWRVRSRSRGRLASSAARVVVVEESWRSRLSNAGLQVHGLDPDGFTCVDENAGYWVSERRARVRTVQRVDDCRAAVAAFDVELRIVESLWSYADAVLEAGGEFSLIRLRNASARPAWPA